MTPWAQRYRKHMTAFVKALGGADNITPTNRAIVRSAAIMQTELALMAQKFAASGSTGATREDLLLFTQTSSTVQSLLESVGLGPDKINRHVAVNQANAEKVYDKHSAELARLLNNLVAARREEDKEAGIVIDVEIEPLTPEQVPELWNVITIHAIADTLYARYRKAAAAAGHITVAGDVDALPPPPAAVHRSVRIDNVRPDNTADEPPPPLRSTPRLVTPDTTQPAKQMSPEEARRRAMAPQPAPPPSGEPSNTALALEWMNGGGGRMRWEPPPGW